MDSSDSPLVPQLLTSWWPIDLLSDHVTTGIGGGSNKAIMLMMIFLVVKKVIQGKTCM